MFVASYVVNRLITSADTRSTWSRWALNADVTSSGVVSADCLQRTTNVAATATATTSAAIRAGTRSLGRARAGSSSVTSGAREVSIASAIRNILGVRFLDGVQVEDRPGPLGHVRGEHGPGTAVYALE